MVTEVNGERSGGRRDSPTAEPREVEQTAAIDIASSVNFGSGEKRKQNRTHSLFSAVGMSPDLKGRFRVNMGFKFAKYIKG